MKRLNNGVLAAIVIALVIIADQALKIWVKTHFCYGEEWMITDWFHLLFIENNGMAFGMELGSKTLLTWFRIIAVVAFCWYLWKIRNRTDLPKGFIVCVSLITAGALGNVIDCICYGMIFDAPPAPQVAQFLPPDGGYASLFHGRVVDMLYFPLCEWNWPQWMPAVGGDHFVFFQPVFNVADAALSVSVFVMIIFYTRYLSTPDENANDTETDATEPAADTDSSNSTEE